MLRSHGKVTYELAHCLQCGGPLPCEKCARKLYEARQREGSLPPTDDEELILAPELAAATASIRAGTWKEGRQPWNSDEQRRRAGGSTLVRQEDIVGSPHEYHRRAQRVAAIWI
jgi:hypothetical protein